MTGSGNPYPTRAVLQFPLSYMTRATIAGIKASTTVNSIVELGILCLPCDAAGIEIPDTIDGKRVTLAMGQAEWRSTSMESILSVLLQTTI